ncbi:MAG: 30S ribosomal protein S12 methylthiotransferase RimO [Anaerolineales bacterium]|nr:30S ribosomal protein S12 methylthiotransferase RimO [Anaerolineales bacterium]
MPHYFLLSLGCAKNTVDSESMGQLLGRAGYTGVENAPDADLLIVNTCGFIAPAREESIEALQELAAGKRPNQKLIAAGCLAQLSGKDLLKKVPGIDGILGTRRWMDLNLLLDRLEGPRRPIIHLPDEALTVGRDEQNVLRAAIQGASAYLKIADGCRHPCAFCAIPLIKGTAVSRPIERIVNEAMQLAGMGIKEIILIAQDTTDYGHDRGEKDGLAVLLEKLTTAAPELDWIRIMYAFPGNITPRLIDNMARFPQVLPYLDIPLQHAHPAVLKRMRRPASVNWVRRTVDRMRKAMPDIAIRTTFIVGYPGETEEEFQTLLDFLLEMQFDRVGAFTYWPEANTPADSLPDQVPDETKYERHERFMSIQHKVSLERNSLQVGRTLDVLIEGQGDGISIGRSYRDAPEIDGLVIIQQELPAGSMLPIRISGAMPYDLMGELVKDGQLITPRFP